MSTTKGNAIEKKPKAAKKKVVAKKDGVEDLLEGAPEEIKNLFGKLKGLKEAIEEHCCKEGEINREVKVKPEWKKRFDEIHAIRDEERKLEAKRQTFGKRVWADIEIDLGVFDKTMYYDEERGVIKIEK